MARKILLLYKFVFGVLIAIFALSLISINGDGVFLKPGLAEAADSARGISEDNPGIIRAIEVQGRHSERLMGIPDVVGHGIGVSSDGEPVIKIFVTRAGIPGIPAALEGVPTKVEVTGMIVAYADPTAWFPRPVPIGVSTGHPDITAGTIGCRVKDSSGNVYALSNNHVYANSNNARIGDYALQPGPYDGGKAPADMIGTLWAFEPINFSGGNNYIDAAIAWSSTDDLGTSTPAGGYGTPNSTLGTPRIGLVVQKYGRTTGLTHGTVDTLNTTVDVCYESRNPFKCLKLARFVDQITITPGTFSAGGDSGSLIVTAEGNNPVGLLFAGSSTRTIANRIETVLNNFDVTVDDSEDDGNTDPPVNNPPIANFSYTTVGLTVNFTDQSFDSDGSVVAWNWNFGANSGTSTESSPTYTYSDGGTYTVTLIVTDDEGATGSTSKSVTVSSGSSSNITLTATVKQNKIWLIVDLVWSGATSVNVDIYRNADKIITTNNDGNYSEKISNSGGGTYTYKVCESGTDNCSGEAAVTF